MKTAILTDHLMERDEVSFMLEVILNMFPDACILTLVHHPGKILGAIEQRKIYSTYLSHIVNNKKDFLRQSYMIPSAVKELPLKEFEQIFCFSRGFSHGVKIEKHQRKFTYILEWNQLVNDYGLGWKAIYWPLVQNWRAIKSFENERYVLSSESLQQNIGLSLPKLAPFFDASYFSFSLEFGKFYLLNSAGMDKKTMDLFVSVFQRLGLNLRIEDNQKQIAQMIHEAKVYIDLNNYELPFSLLRAFSTGCPSIIKKNKVNQEFFSNSTSLMIEELEKEILTQKISNFEKERTLIDRKKLRREALKFNGRFFKQQLKDNLQAFFK